jgi:hypothetical protein
MSSPCRLGFLSVLAFLDFKAKRARSPPSVSVKKFSA